MIKIKIIIIGLVIALPAFSQKSLSLQESRTLALEFNKSLKMSSLQKVAAEAKRKEVFTNYLPKVEASGNMMHYPTMDNNSLAPFAFPSAADPTVPSNALFPGVDIETEDLFVLSGGVNLVQPIYAGGKIRSANKMARIGEEIAEQAFQLKEAEVILNTDEAYWNLAAINEKVKLANKYVNLLDSLEGTLRDSYELGLVPKSEVLKVTVKKNSAELNLLRAKNGYRIMQMNFCRIIGLPLNTEIKITEELSKEPVLPTFTDVSKSAIANRQELQMLEGQAKISALEEKMAKADFLPQLGAQFGYNHLKISDIIDQGSISIAASLQIPIFHWNERKHKVAVERAKREQVLVNQSKTQELIQLEVQQVIIQLQEGYEYVLLSNKNKQEANESLEETQVSFEVGLNTTTDLLNAQAAWQQAVAQEIEALTQFEVLKTKYNKVLGIL